MKVKVKSTGVVRPGEERQRQGLWLSSVDLVIPAYHLGTVFVYEANVAPDFFDAGAVKAGLARAFYPMAGRLWRDPAGRLEIDCNGQGALFVEADTTSALEDLGDLLPAAELAALIPAVDSSAAGMLSSPLLLVQVTCFKCGGVVLGLRMQHLVADGKSALHFINAWANTTRGFDISIPSFINRTLLKGRDPPRPTFHHPEYQSPPKLQTYHVENPAKVPIIGTFKITIDQMKALKAKTNKDDNKKYYSSYQILAGHIWHCVSKARCLADTQETKFYIAIDARSRLESPLPQGFFGNAIFSTTPMATVGELVSNPASYASEKIHEAITKMEDEYLRSAIDFREKQLDPTVLARGANTFKCPNLSITSWSKMGIHDSNFGWGRPVYMGPTAIPFEGSAYILPNSVSGGGFSVCIALQDEHILKLFEEHLYNI